MIYKMLVLNIDGTLVQDNGQINKWTREAIEYAQHKGIIITIATSKNFLAAKRVAKTLKIDTHIVSHQGAYISTELNKPIFVSRIHEQITSEMIALLESFPCQIKLVHEQFTLGNKMKLPDQMLARVIFQSGGRMSYSEQYVDLISERLFDQPVSPPMIKVQFDRRADLLDANQALEEMYNEVHCIQSDDLTLEIVAAGVSKLSGVSYVCERLGIHREEVVAIGAGLDDLALIQWAGLGVAMKNAPMDVQTAADWVTRSNNDNGVAYIVKEHFRKQYRLEFLRKINIIR